MKMWEWSPKMHNFHRNVQFECTVFTFNVILVMPMTNNWYGSVQSPLLFLKTGMVRLFRAAKSSWSALLLKRAQDCWLFRVGMHKIENGVGMHKICVGMHNIENCVGMHKIVLVCTTFLVRTKLCWYAQNCRHAKYWKWRWYAQNRCSSSRYKRKDAISDGYSTMDGWISWLGEA